jgi:hypothetical protein
MTTQPDDGYFGYTCDEWNEIFNKLDSLRAVHPDMNPKFWEDDIFEIAGIFNNKRRRDTNRTYNANLTSSGTMSSEVLK